MPVEWSAVSQTGQSVQPKGQTNENQSFERQVEDCGHRQDE
jgi:hypothetical protein